MSAPIPGSSDERAARSRVARAVDRGERLPTDWEARMAVEIASERLARLPRERNRALAFGAGQVLIGAPVLAMGSTLLGVALLLVGVLTLVVLLPLLSKVVRPRLERAHRANAEALATGEPAA